MSYTYMINQQMHIYKHVQLYIILQHVSVTPVTIIITSNPFYCTQHYLPNRVWINYTSIKQL